jgi:hypothetical protein
MNWHWIKRTVPFFTGFHAALLLAWIRLGCLLVLALFLSGFEFLGLGEAEETGRANKHKSPQGTEWARERERDGARQLGNGIVGLSNSMTKMFIYLAETKRTFPEIIWAPAPVPLSALSTEPVSWVGKEPPGEACEVSHLVVQPNGIPSSSQTLNSSITKRPHCTPFHSQKAVRHKTQGKVRCMLDAQSVIPTWLTVNITERSSVYLGIRIFKITAN